MVQAGLNYVDANTDLLDMAAPRSIATGRQAGRLAGGRARRRRRQAGEAGRWDKWHSVSVHFAVIRAGWTVGHPQSGTGPFSLAAIIIRSD